jgi:hypothetical protein
MGDKSIKNTQVKKKKKADAAKVTAAPLKSVVTQPEVIVKKKKPL